MESSKHKLHEFDNSDEIPLSKYLVTFPLSIKVTKCIAHMIKDKQRHLQITTICEQCDKNHKLPVLSVRFLISNLPKIRKVLSPVLVSTVKKNPSDPDVYDLRIRLCDNGSTQSADLKYSCSAVCLADSLRISVSLAASFYLFLSFLDAINYYQNIMLTKEKITYIHPPPFRQNGSASHALACVYLTPKPQNQLSKLRAHSKTLNHLANCGMIVSAQF